MEGYKKLGCVEFGQYIYDSTTIDPPNWVKLADIDWGDHNSLGGRDAADAHPSTSISFDNTVSGLAATTVKLAIDELSVEQGVDIDNLLIVATNGSDSDLATGVDLGTWANPYATVQAAHDSITGSAVDNPYLIWVAPGEYTENVALSKGYVYVTGANRNSTIITSAISIPVARS